MSDEIQETPVADELTALKQRADFLGVSYHPSIGVEKLREKVNNFIQGVKTDDEVAAPTAQEVESENARRIRLKMESNKLVRVNVTCLNPAKREWRGEIFTIGNGVIGTLRKFVPFNTTDGWHVPQAILTMMEERMCQIFVTKTVAVAGRDQKVREGKLIKEFSIQRLPNLTEDELKELARRQAMAAGQTA